MYLRPVWVASCPSSPLPARKLLAVTEQLKVAVGRRAARAILIDDQGKLDISRDWCRLMGLTPLMLFTTTLLVVRNQRILAA
jgi:hypothetical protein